VAESRILMGVVGRPHGVRGLVHVTSYADDLTAHGALLDARGRRFVLRWRGEGVAEVAEVVDGVEVKVGDRTAAEGLTNTRLYVERAQLPEPEEDEFYLADLVGLAAFDGDGARVGTVAVVHDYGAGASLEIERDGAAALLVPFTRACVPEVDVVAGRIVVAPPAEVDAVGLGTGALELAPPPPPTPLPQGEGEYCS
jgi:16S rRNA processing protein RimM